jgi:hypothetical protein
MRELRKLGWHKSIGPTSTDESLSPELRSGEQADGERHHLARRLRPTAPTQP